MLFSACQKEEIDSIPEGAIKLTTEGFSNGDGSKTSVNGYTVEWVDNDPVVFYVGTGDAQNRTVTVDGSQAYIASALDGSGIIRGYYSCGTITNGNTDGPTVTINVHKGSNYYTYEHTASVPAALTRNKMLTARCDINLSGHAAPTGTINGKFTINASGNQVYFSQDNLQATTTDLGVNWTWAFATNQWDYIGYATANNSINGDGTVSTNGTVDLFGWVGASSTWTGAAQYGISNSLEDNVCLRRSIQGEWHSGVYSLDPFHQTIRPPGKGRQLIPSHKKPSKEPAFGLALFVYQLVLY